MSDSWQTEATQRGKVRLRLRLGRGNKWKRNGDEGVVVVVVVLAVLNKKKRRTTGDLARSYL